MNSVYDVIVVGLGGMGSSAAFHLAHEGLRVLGIEQFAIGHDRGSSHGDTRLIRRAYFEETRYVPLLNESYRLWHDLEEKSGTKLLHACGLLAFTPPQGGMARAGILKAAAEFKIPVEQLTLSEVKSRFPVFAPPAEYTAVFEPGAGFLEVDRCVQTYAHEAGALGADLQPNTNVQGWRYDPARKEFTVTTSTATYRAKKLVLTAGAWTSPLLADLSLPLTVQRIPQCWFSSTPKMENAPCFAFDTPQGFFYGFPARPNLGVKVAEYKPSPSVVLPERLAALNREVTEAEIAGVCAAVTAYLPEVSIKTTARSVCLYTMTPDEHFLLDAHPEFPGCYFAAGFSGHGFKFASFIGRWLATRVLEETPSCNTDFLALRRFLH